MKADQTTAQQIQRQFAKEGVSATRWSNGPHAVYGVHEHPYGKILVVVEGRITFRFASGGRQVTMKPWDRLEIPAETPHSAVAGPEGVECLEAHLTEGR